MILSKTNQGCSFASSVRISQINTNSFKAEIKSCDPVPDPKSNSYILNPYLKPTLKELTLILILDCFRCKSQLTTIFVSMVYRYKHSTGLRKCQFYVWEQSIL